MALLGNKVGSKLFRRAVQQGATYNLLNFAMMEVDTSVKSSHFYRNEDKVRFKKQDEPDCVKIINVYRVTL